MTNYANFMTHYKMRSPAVQLWERKVVTAE